MTQQTKEYPDQLVKELQKAERIVDGLGMPVDEDIKLLVAALQCFGFNTIASCGGHLDRLWSSAPWVDIASPERPEFIRKRSELMKTGRDRNEFQWIGLKNEEKQANAREIDRLLRLLGEFYASNDAYKRAQINTRLIVTGSMCRLSCQGEDVVGLDGNEEVRAKWLYDARSEMNDFAEFLCGKMDKT